MFTKSGFLSPSHLASVRHKPNSFKIKVVIIQLLVLIENPFNSEEE